LIPNQRGRKRERQAVNAFVSRVTQVSFLSLSLTPRCRTLNGALTMALTVPSSCPGVPKKKNVVSTVGHIFFPPIVGGGIKGTIVAARAIIDYHLIAIPFLSFSRSLCVSMCFSFWHTRTLVRVRKPCVRPSTSEKEP